MPFVSWAERAPSSDKCTDHCYAWLMTSGAATTFSQRTQDVDRLMEIHTDIGGTDVGRRVGVEVLNRSAIVLITAMWEGYVEDLAAEAVEHLVEHVQAPDGLPVALRRQVAAELKTDSHDLAAWKLAGDGWQAHLKGRLADYAVATARNLNTPMTDRVDGLFRRAVGLPRVSDSWEWHRMTAATARTKLDAIVKLRGDVAHGSGVARPVNKATVTRALNHCQRLVQQTDGAVNADLSTQTGVSLF